MKLAAAYYRCSTEEQATEGLSIPSQRLVVEGYAAVQDIRIVATYIDEGLSSTLPPDRRPGLARLLQDSHTAAWRLLLVRDEDRIVRGKNLPGKILFELEDEAGLEIIAVKHPDASPIEKGFRQLMGAEFIRKLRSEVRDGLRTAWEEGHRFGRRPYGYDWQGNTLVPVPDELPHAVEMFERFAAGETSGALAREMGWHVERVLWLLANPVYSGGRAWGRAPRVYGKGRRKQRRSKDFDIRWGTHEPAVPRETWDAVQMILRSRRRPNHPHEGRLALAGLLQCVCGGRMKCSSWWNTRTGRTFRWTCRSCGAAVSESTWADRIVGAVAAWFAESDLAVSIAEALRQAYEAGTTLAAAEARVRQLREAQARLLDAITSGAISDTRSLSERLETVQQDLVAADRALRAEQERSRKTVPSVSQVRAELAGYARALAEIEGAAYDARPLLQLLVGTVVIDPSAAESGDISISESIAGSHWLSLGTFVRRVRLVA